jgi:NAD kinase
MDRLQNKIVLVTRRSRLDDLIVRFNTVDQARFYIEHLGADFRDYSQEHETYHGIARHVEATLSEYGRVQRLDRAFLPNFMFAEDMLVVVLGQDGLVANTLKYVKAQSVIGVNPDPKRWNGVLLPFESADLTHVVPEALAGRRPLKAVTMARARLSDGQTLYAVNDLFIGGKSHVSARYEITCGKKSESHSSSGIIVSTGLGSSGWFRSVLTGATAIAHHSTPALANLRDQGFPWDADYLYFSVREPFPSVTSQTDLVFGKVSAKTPLRLVSKMPDYGVVFSDGIEADFLEFNSGMEVIVDVAVCQGTLVV